jgi:hypothetical protein
VGRIAPPIHGGGKSLIEKYEPYFLITFIKNDSEPTDFLTAKPIQSDAKKSSCRPTVALCLTSRTFARLRG